MDLALDDHRVDDAPEIVGAGEIQQRNDAGLAIDLYLGNVATGRIGEIRWIVEGGLFEAGFHRFDRKLCGT